MGSYKHPSRTLEHRLPYPTLRGYYHAFWVVGTRRPLSKIVVGGGKRRAVRKNPNISLIMRRLVQRSSAFEGDCIWCTSNSATWDHRVRSSSRSSPGSPDHLTLPASRPSTLPLDDHLDDAANTSTVPPSSLASFSRTSTVRCTVRDAPSSRIQAHTRCPPLDLSPGYFSWESVRSRYALREGVWEIDEEVTSGARVRLVGKPLVRKSPHGISAVSVEPGYTDCTVRFICFQ